MPDHYADDIYSDINRKKQLEDANKHKKFDRKMDAYRRGKNLTDEERKKILSENAEERKLLGSEILNNLEARLGDIGSTIVESAKEDPDTWTDDAIRLGLGGAKNVGNVLNAPGIKQALQGLGAPAWIVGRGLGWTLEKAGVDPRYGHIAGEVGEWFIPFYGAGKLVKKAKQLSRGLSTIDNLSPSVAAARRGPLSPSSGDISNVENVLNPERLAKIKTLKTDLLRDLNVKLGTNPDQIPLRVAGAMVAEEMAPYSRFFDRTGWYDYNIFRKYISDLDTTKYQTKGRGFLSEFQTPTTIGGQSRGVRFKGVTKAELPKLREEFGPAFKALGIPDIQGVQIHHIAALKSIMGIYHKTQCNSPLYKQINERLLKQLPGLGKPGLGDMAENLLPVVGRTSDVGTPHHLVHRFYNDRLGATGAGESFFTPKVISRMEIDTNFRLRKADQLATVIRKSEQIVKKAQRTFTDLYSNKDISFEEVFERLNELDEFGYAKLIDPKYQLPDIPKLIGEIVKDIEAGNLPSIVGKTLSKEEFTRTMEKMKRSVDWDELGLADKMRYMQEQTGMTYDELDELIKSGWINPEDL